MWQLKVARGLVVTSIYAFVLLTLLVPNSIANKIAFVWTIIASLVFTSVRALEQEVPTLAPFAVVGIFSYGYVLSLIGGGDSLLARQFFLSVAVLFLVYPLVWWRIDVDRLVVVTGMVLAISTTAAGLMVVLSPGTAIGTAAVTYFTDYSMGAYGSRDFGAGEAVMVHAGAAPFLFLTYSVLLHSFAGTRTLWKLVFLALLLLSLAATTSRALAGAALVSTLYFAVQRLRAELRIVALALAVAALLFGGYLIYQATDVLSSEEVSNSIKLGHLSSYLSSQTMWTLLFGEGLGAMYFSSGAGEVLAHTEITPMDMARYIGVPLVILLYGILLRPSSQLRNDSAAKDALFLMLVYHVVALTNPVLLNSYGLLIVLWYWVRVLPPAGGRAL